MSREIDMLVAKAIGWEETNESWISPNGSKLPKYHHGRDLDQLPRFSEDIAAAWEVVGMFPKFWNMNFNDMITLKNYFVDFGEGSHAYSETAPMAICLSALKAKGIEVTD